MIRASQGLFSRIDLYPLLLIVYLICAYGLAISTPLIWNEEYPCLWDPATCAIDQIRDLRPLYGLVNFLFFTLSNVVNSLLPYRLFGFLGFVILNVLILKSLSLTTSKKRMSSLVFATALTSTLPGFMTMAFSPNIAVYSWSSALAILSINLMARNQFWIASILMVTSLLLYPPSTFFVFSFLIVKHLSLESFLLRDYLREFILLFSNIVFSSVLAFIFSRLFLLLGNWTQKDRVSLINFESLDEKFVFVLTRYIPASLRGFALTSPEMIEALISSIFFTLILITLLARYVNWCLKEVSKILLAICLAFFTSLSPFILTSSNEIDFRIIRNSSWLIWFIILFFGHLLFSSLKINFYRPSIYIHRFITLIVVILSLLMVNWRYVVYFHLPFKEKSDFIITSLLACPKSLNLERDLLIKDKFKDYPRYKNIGVFSLVTDLSQDWVPEPNVQLLAKNKFNNDLQGSKNRNTSCVVDFNNYFPTKWAD